MKLERVEIIVSGFTVVDPAVDQESATEVARDLASDIGMRLADLGPESRHGQVTIRYGGIEASS